MKTTMHFVAVLAAPLLLSGCMDEKGWQDSARILLEQAGNGNSIAGSLSDGQIAQGLREALRVGTEQVVAQVSQTGGYLNDPKIHIPLPGSLARVDSALKTIGMDGLTRELETRMNRAAEQAAPEAKALFVKAISEMTLADARSILSAQEDAATQYLRRSMGADLQQKMQPFIEQALAQTGAVQAYDRVVKEYSALPLVVGDVKANLKAHVSEKAVDGIFHYVAQEEAAIRRDPAKRTSEILRTVFGAR